MDEATLGRKPRRKRIFRAPRLRRDQRGQAFLEFALVLLLSLAFLRFVFFNKDYGFKASLDRVMLRLGTQLEANLKTGTKLGGDGQKSLEPFAGTSRWNN